MQSKQLKELIHGETNKRMADEELARKRFDELMAEHRLPVESKILGVATLFQREFDYTFSHSASANHYRKAGISVFVQFLLKMGTVKSWAEVTPILEALALVGFDVDKWETADHAATYSRSYKYKLTYAAYDEPDPNKIGDLYVELVFNLPGDTDTCRRVLKGYTSRCDLGGQPIYELVCD